MVKWIYICPAIKGLEIKLNEMDTAGVTGDWNERKGKLSQKFASLTENDKMIEDGKTEEMLAKLEVKLGKSKDELRKIIDSF